MTKKFLVTLLLVSLLWPIGANATETLETVDSLLTLYDKAPARKRYDLGRQLLAVYRENEAFLDEALFDNAIELSREMPADSLDLMVWYSTVRFYYVNAYFAEGLVYADRALPLAPPQPNIHATLLCDKGYFLFKTGDLTASTLTEREAVRISQSAGNKLQLSRAYLYLSIVNYTLQKFDEAKLFVNKAINIDEELADNQLSHNTLGIACEIYSGAGDLDQAEQYGWKAVEAARAINFTAGVANHLSQLSYTYNRKKEYQKGIDCAQQAIEIVEQMEIPDRNLLALSIEYKAYNLLDMGRGEESLVELKRAIPLQEELGNTRSLCTDMRTLYEILLPIDSLEAMKALERYTYLHDSIYNDELNNSISQANAEFRNDELSRENAHRHRANQWLWGGVIALGLVIVFLMVFAYRHVKAQREQQKHILELLKTLTPATPPTPRQPKPVKAEKPTVTAPEEKQEPNLWLNTVNTTIHELMPRGEADVEHVASELCVSPSQFRRRIQAATGLTPSNYIMAIRMDEAKRLLAMHPKYALSDIATRCGFADHAHFTHAFRRIFGITPLQFAQSSTSASRNG